MKTDYIIMCGGEGIRLRPFTYIIPKPFLTTNNISPFDYIIKNIDLKKTNNIYVSLKYKQDLAKKIIKNKNFSKIKIVLEKNSLGTAGCLRNILKENISDYFIIINGDIFAKFNFSEMINFHIKKRHDLTVGITNYEKSIPYAVLRKKNNKKYFKEKPKLKMKINTGIYILSKKFAIKFFKINKNEFVNMTDLIDNASRLGTFDIGDKWIDIGHIRDFKMANSRIKEW